MSNMGRTFGVAVAFLGLVSVACVGMLAIYFSNVPAALRPIAAGIFALVAMSLILSGLRKRKRWAWGVFLGLFATLSTVTYDNAVSLNTASEAKTAVSLNDTFSAPKTAAT